MNTKLSPTGRKKRKDWKGREAYLKVRVTREEHERALRAAAVTGASVQEWSHRIIMNAVTRALRESD